MAQRAQLRANVSASGGEEHDSGGGGDNSGRKGPKLDVFLNMSLNVSSPATKKIAAKVRAQLARKDPAFMSVVDRFQDVKCSQEISLACLELQRAME